MRKLVHALASVESSSQADRNSGMSKARTEALTDGIYAFAMTLLVLTISVPTVAPPGTTDDNLHMALIEHISDFVHYAVAFLVLAIFWVSHHQLWGKLKYIDDTLLWLNILSLMFVALLPFSTAFAQTYVDFPMSAIVFEVNILLVWLPMYLQWKHLRRNAVLRAEGLDARELDRTERRIMVTPAITVVAIAVAIAGSAWSTALYLLTPLVMKFVDRK
ncbi:Uncharacterised protein [Candidatus Burarchaeum australiense]|nr:Uncharacterised protein [Candidatus Burarchaeum australiense]